MIETITFNSKNYLLIQTEGNMTQYAFPFAKKFCKGVGYDIGYGKKEWIFEDSIGIDINDESPYDCFNLPDGQVDYIYSSHCLEHTDDWVKALEIWVSKLKVGGVLFLYLPHEDQEYWRPWNNRKHKHLLRAVDIEECMKSFGLSNIFYGERDLNYSFMIVGEKVEQ
jgi:predicted SAM-dependent methyltransferase